MDESLGIKLQRSKKLEIIRQDIKSDIGLKNVSYTINFLLLISERIKKD
jgi:hypothetical protein